MNINDAKPGMKIVVTDFSLRGYGEEFEIFRVDNAATNTPWSNRIWVDSGRRYYLPGSVEIAPIVTPKPEIVAWQYSIAKARYLDGSGYTDFGPLEISTTKPNVPEGSIRDLRPLIYGDLT